MDAAGTLDEDQSIGDWVPGQIGSKSVGVGEGRVAIAPASVKCLPTRNTSSIRALLQQFDDLAVLLVPSNSPVRACLLK